MTPLTQRPKGRFTGNRTPNPDSVISIAALANGAPTASAIENKCQGGRIGRTLRVGLQRPPEPRLTVLRTLHKVV